MPSARSIVTAAALDAALVLVFVIVGRGSHEEGFSLPGLLQTSWPFLAGAAAGWLLARAWRGPARIVWTGIVVWIATVVVGVLLRAASGQGVRLSFVIVTVLVLGFFVLGWRSIAKLGTVLRRRRA